MDSHIKRLVTKTCMLEILEVYHYLILNYTCFYINRYKFRNVSTGPGKPGKSWNFIVAFSRKFQATGPGKFWKSGKS